MKWVLLEDKVFAQDKYIGEVNKGRITWLYACHSFNPHVWKAFNALKKSEPWPGSGYEDKKTWKIEEMTKEEAFLEML